MKPMKFNTFGKVTAVTAACAIAAAVAVAQQQLTVPNSTHPGAAHAEALSITFRDVAKAVLPAVVSIETRTKAVAINQPNMGRGQLDNEFMKRFFGEDFDPNEQFRQRQMPQQRGSGSGFIIDSSGVILTNAHVVDGAERIIVTLEDGRELAATEWHADPRSDVAIIRIESDEPLPQIPMGNSDEMEIGDWVLALGNPFDIGTTVTSGIISAKGRNMGINDRESYLQTDAAINPGNSGGPLVNLRGEVVGMNTAISTRSGGYDGVGFAIPINSAHWVSDQLAATGSVKRAYLGVQIQSMSPNLRAQFSVPNGHGALVAHVYDGSPAGEGGVEVGDVILRFAGQDVKSSVHLQGVVEQLEVGKAYPMAVLRNGEEVELNVSLKEMPNDFSPAMKRFHESESAVPESEEFNELGLEIGQANEDQARQLGIEGDLHGVLVTAVDPNGPAAQQGIRTGDLIERVGSKEVASPEEFEAVVSEMSLEEGVVMLVRNRQGTHFVVVNSDN